MKTFGENIDLLIRELPDPEGARIFYERICAENSRASRLLAHDFGLLSDALALSAWSPLLATTLLQNRDLLGWLARERTLNRVKTAEELGESLARFALTNSQLDPQVLLARFRRRELLRTYLRDIRRISTLVETTEELSNLADAILQYALGLAQQQLDNFYGAPQRTNERGRTATASFCVVALGKLGSRELNYASDIDLLFLYSDDGATSGQGERGAISNREYFSKLAGYIARIVGQPTGEGAAYRVDLRLRPHGRDGALACSLAEALRYYRGTAQPWEVQALIRARSAAGDANLYATFSEQVRERVYRTDETVGRALAHVRLAKQKIDRHHGAAARGYNVKLGCGGIREIEFIAQALQLAHGGRDAWLHAPHTLISLGRLADRALITERERTELSDAYVFLRMLEHRVQMEHGLQTHTVPEDAERRLLVARRMNFTGPDALAAFDRALLSQTAHVRAAYERVFETAPVAAAEEQRFAEAAGERRAASHRGEELIAPFPEDTVVNEATAAPQEAAKAAAENGAAGFVVERGIHEAPLDAEAAAVAAAVFARRLAAREGTLPAHGETAAGGEKLAEMLRETARGSLNARRALASVARVAASLDKYPQPIELSVESLATLVRLCGASDLFGEMLASNPALIAALKTSPEIVAGRDYRALLRARIDAEKSFGGELTALRRQWSHLLVELGACDTAGAISIKESNVLQTKLAAASLNAGYLIARRELARRHGKLGAGPRLAVLGLGRLGSGGIDYGSDLDIVFVYDSGVPSPLASYTHEAAYARLGEVIVAALSSLTRDGYLYRVDMRLRPDGKNGAVASGAQSFVSYLRERATAWEWLAYVKLRAVAGDLELGQSVERAARRALHDAARRAEPEVLRMETRRVRNRLERERSGRAQTRAIDIKFGAGGMLDVYFAARYLQLRDHVSDETSDRSTHATLANLYAAGSIMAEDHAALAAGYTLLRRLDHHLRLLVGRSTRLPLAEDHPLLRDLARAAQYSSVALLTDELARHMKAIRAAYDRITG